MPTFETPGRVALRLDVPAGDVTIADVGRAAGRRRRHARCAATTALARRPPPRRGSRRRERGGRHEITVRVPKREGRFGISWGRGPELDVVGPLPRGSRPRAHDAQRRPRGARAARRRRRRARPPATSTFSTRPSLVVTTASGDLTRRRRRGHAHRQVGLGRRRRPGGRGQGDRRTPSRATSGSAGPVSAATLSTVSGDVDLELAEGGVRVNSVSGDVAVAMRPGLVALARRRSR